MSLIVSIMNKRGVAVAADSSSSRANGNHYKKASDNAHKIFHIDGSQIIVATCGNTEFMGRPIDVLIQDFIFANKKRVFKSLDECKNEFLKFLADNKDLFSAKSREVFLDKEIVEFCNSIIEDDEDLSISKRLHKAIDEYTLSERKNTPGDSDAK